MDRRCLWAYEIFTRMTEYLDLLERYYDRHFYRRICNDHYSFEHTTWFIETVAVYKNSRSAALLSAILNKRPMISCRPIILDADKELTHDIYNAVHKNRSDVYKSIQPAAENTRIVYQVNKLPFEWAMALTRIKSPENQVVKNLPRSGAAVN